MVFLLFRHSDCNSSWKESNIWSFFEMLFCYIFWVFNEEANRLSKLAIGNMDDCLYFQEFRDDVIIESGLAKVFWYLPALVCSNTTFMMVLLCWIFGSWNYLTRSKEVGSWLWVQVLLWKFVPVRFKDFF